MKTDDFTLKVNGNSYSTMSLQNMPITDVMDMMLDANVKMTGSMVGTDAQGNIRMWSVFDEEGNRVPDDTYHRTIWNDKLYDVVTKKNGTKSYRYKGNQTGVYPINP